MPAYSESTISAVFAKTQGHCTYCGGRLWRNKHLADQQPDAAGDEGVWWVGRWRPRSRMRTAAECDAHENLWPTCPACGSEKAETTGSEYLWSRFASKRDVLQLWHAWLKDMQD